MGPPEGGQGTQDSTEETNDGSGSADGSGEGITDNECNPGEKNCGPLLFVVFAG